MIGGLNTATLASVTSLDDEVLDWYTAVKGDGGDANSITLDALHEFVTTLKINGVRDKIKRCNLFCGENLRSCLHPIIKGEANKSIGSKKDINYGFRSADYSKSEGLSARNSAAGILGPAGKYLLTGTFLTSLGLDNWGGHLSFMSYVGSASLDSAGGYMMPLSGGDYSIKNDLSAYIEFDNEANIRAASPSSFNPSSARGYVELDSWLDVGGFFLANRTSNINQKLYKNAAVIDDSDATLDQSLNPIGGYKFRIFSAYSGGQETQTSVSKLLFYSLGERLTEDNITILNNALIKFNDSLGRN